MVYIVGVRLISGLGGGTGEGAYSAVKDWARKREEEIDKEVKGEEERHEKKVKKIKGSTLDEIAARLNSHFSRM